MSSKFTPEFLALLPKPPDPLALRPKPPEVPKLELGPKVEELKGRKDYELFGFEPRIIYDDARARPEHYTPDQRALLEQMLRGKKPPQRDLTDLVTTFMRPTEAKKLVKDLNAKLAKKRVEKKAEKPKPKGLFGIAASFGKAMQVEDGDEDDGPTIKII